MYNLLIDNDLSGYGLVKRVLASSLNLAEGMTTLIGLCRERHPHPYWDQVANLDFQADADAMHDWFVRQLPIPEPVAVLWFATWDVTEGFDLRGSSSWSRDPDDWEWWYRDDFKFGSYKSPVLVAAIEIANDAERYPEEQFRELVDWAVAVGYVSLAAIEIMRRIDPARLLGGRDELWAVSGIPDAVYGVILGRVGAAGFEHA